MDTTPAPGSQGCGRGGAKIADLEPSDRTKGLLGCTRTPKSKKLEYLVLMLLGLDGNNEGALSWLQRLSWLGWKRAQSPYLWALEKRSDS